jgi:hypothetical protein
MGTKEIVQMAASAFKYLVHENRACARDYVPLNDAPGMIEFC